MALIKIFWSKLKGIFSYDETELTLVRCVEHSQPRHLRIAIFSTVATIFASVFSALIAAVILSLAGYSYEWSDFVTNGEVAIFCVGLLSASILTIAKELKSPFAHRQLFSFLSLGGLIFAIACYAGLCVSNARAAQSEAVDDKATMAIVLSGAIYLFTIAISFVITFVDEVRDDLPDRLVTQAREALSGDAGLREKFHGLGGE